MTPLAANDMVRDSTSVDLLALGSPRRVLLPSSDTMQTFHSNGESSFASTSSFGFIKGKDRVAGFVSHGLSNVARIDSITSDRRKWYRKPQQLWAIHRMELVSLLKHDKPVVYESRNMPRMEDLGQAKTRPLNPFEQSGLQQIIEGEDVVTRSSLNRVEMVGSLRASNECLECHEVQRGALLGVFTYELLRDPQIDPNSVSQELSNRETPSSPLKNE